MKAAVDKNETVLDKMKREALEWLEIRGKTAPSFIGVAVNAFNAIQFESLEKEDKLKSTIREVIWQFCYGKGDTDALFSYRDIEEATKQITELYFQPE